MSFFTNKQTKITLCFEKLFVFQSALSCISGNLHFLFNSCYQTGTTCKWTAASLLFFLVLFTCLELSALTPNTDTAGQFRLCLFAATLSDSQQISACFCICTAFSHENVSLTSLFCVMQKMRNSETFSTSQFCF